MGEKSQKGKSKLEKISGLIVEKEENTRGLFDEEVTLYIMQDDLKEVRCGFVGFYKDSPEEGDLVEVYLSDEICARLNWVKRKKTDDGYFEFEEKFIGYREIKKYKILEDSKK